MIPYRRPERGGRPAKRRQKTAPSFSHEVPYRGPCCYRLLFHVTSENSLTRLRGGGGGPQGGYIHIGAASHINIFSRARDVYTEQTTALNCTLQDRTFFLIYLKQLVTHSHNADFQCCGTGSGRIGIFLTDQDPYLFQPDVKLNYTFSRKFRYTVQSIGIDDTYYVDEKDKTT